MQRNTAEPRMIWVMVLNLFLVLGISIPTYVRSAFNGKCNHLVLCSEALGQGVHRPVRHN